MNTYFSWNQEADWQQSLRQTKGRKSHHPLPPPPIPPLHCPAYQPDGPQPLPLPWQAEVVDDLPVGRRLQSRRHVGGVGAHVVAHHKLGQPLVLDRVHLITHHAQDVEPAQGGRGEGGGMVRAETLAW